MSLLDMSKREQSYIEVSVVGVIKACEDTIQRIEKHRNDDFEKKVNRYVESYNNGWWNRFRKKTITKEEATNVLKHSCGDSIFSEYEWSMVYAGEQYDHCQNILRLCKQSGKSTINLTVADATVINYENS